MLEHRQYHGRSTTRDMTAFAANHLHGFDGIKGQQRINRIAEVERGEKTDHDACHMKERKYHTAVKVLHGQSFTLGERFQTLPIDHRVVHQAIMCQQGPFRIARRPGGIHQDGRVRRSDLGLSLAQCLVTYGRAASDHLAEECRPLARLFKQTSRRHAH